MAHKEHTLLGNFDFDGYWWLPDRPDHQVAGTLKFRGGRSVELYLRGALSDPLSSAFSAVQASAIKGTRDDGAPCTLFDAFVSRRSFGTSALSRETYRGNVLVIGGSFDSREQVRLASVQVRYSALLGWLEYYPFRRASGRRPPEFAAPPTFEVYVPELQASLRLGGQPLRHSAISSAAYVKYTYAPHIDFIAEEPKPYDWYLDSLYDFRNLLTLLVGHPTHPTHMHARAPDALMEEAHDRRALELFNIVNCAEGSPEFVLGPHTLIPRASVGGQLENLVQRWYAARKALKPALGLFFGTICGGVRFPDQQLLNFTHAIEAFHRCTRKAMYVAEDKYSDYAQALYDSFPEEMPTDLRKALRDRLRYGNEYSLRKRLNALLDELSDRLRALITNDPKRFTNSVVDTRNYFIHHEASLAAKALAGDPLVKTNQALRWLLTMLLLRQMDIGDELIFDRISKLTSSNGPMAPV